MEPRGNQNCDNSWCNNADLLRILEPHRRRRQGTAEEKEPFSQQTPLFAKPYKTDKDELSRRIQNVLGDYEDFKVLLSEKFPQNPIWIAGKSKSKSWSRRHRLTSRTTNTYEGTWRKSSRKSPGLTPNRDQNRDSNEGPSNTKAETKAEQSTFRILPEPVKPILHVYVQSIEGILKEMSSSLPPLLTPPQTPTRGETNKLPLLTKEKNPMNVPSIEDILREMSSSMPPLLTPPQTPRRAETYNFPWPTKGSQPDGSAAPKLSKQKGRENPVLSVLTEQAGAASETLPSSQPSASALQCQHKRVAAAQPSSSESGSTSDSPSASVSDRESSSGDSEQDKLPGLLDRPAHEPEPSTPNKWWLVNWLTKR